MMIRDSSVTLGELHSRGAKISYSQFGEDILLAHFMRHEGGFYIDVGCHDPFRFSNTAMLHTYKGWSGINIDADPTAIEKFRIARPNDINLNMGVGDVSGSMQFSMFRDAAWNSFDPAMIENASKLQRVERTLTVEVKPLKDILDKHLPAGRSIDYMNIDCEGFDDKVIAGNDWNLYSPKFLSVEIHGLKLETASDHPVVRSLSRSGYMFRSQCHVTSLFQRRF